MNSIMRCVPRGVQKWQLGREIVWFRSLPRSGALATAGLKPEVRRVETTDGEPERPKGVVIPPDQLDAETLRGVVESYVNREGTDYGERERSLAEKVEDVLGQLRSGEAVILFDPETESINLVPAAEAGETPE